MEQTLLKTGSRGLSANSLKIIAIIAMTIDHVAWGFVPTATLLGELMHIIGRLTAPIMCFFIAEGYTKTKNVEKYLLRLGVFALISHIPFVLFEKWRLILFSSTSMIFSLFVSLLAVVIYDSKKLHFLLKWLLIILCVTVTAFSDWSFLAVIWSLIFFTKRSDKKDMWQTFLIVSAVFALIMTINSYWGGAPWWRSLFQFGTLLACPVLLQYNGERGKARLKWFFYIYYPLHLLVIVAIRQYVRFGYTFK